MKFVRPTIFLASLACLWPSGSLPAQDEAPPPKKEGVQIVFLPPPMEGEISLGLYDASGKLVRTLHREATDKEFKKGLNGFITQWDGRNDAGQPLPAGKYVAKGWMIGDLAVDGVAFHGNDWLKGEDSPHFTQVLSVQNHGHDEIQVVLRATDGAEHTVGWKLEKPDAALPASEVEATLDAGKLVIRQGNKVAAAVLAEGEKAVAASVGSAGRVWAIIETSLGREVRAYSETGEFLRRLAYAPEEPAPQQLAASPWTETIFLLEKNATEQRLRALSLGTPRPDGTSTWKTVYQKRILLTDTFAAAAPGLGRTPPPQPVEELKVRSKPNPLLQHAKTDLRFRVVPDVKGSLLVASDGLPLTHLTDTSALKWCVLVPEKDGTATLFEGDGAVVGEFKLGKLSNVMAFEAGDYELER